MNKTTKDRMYPVYLSDLNDERRRYLEKEIRAGYHGQRLKEALKEGYSIQIGKMYYYKRCRV